MRVMSISTLNGKSGKKELIDYLRIAEVAGARLVVFPSSYLPYYKNASAFYHRQDINALPTVIPKNITIVAGVNFIEDDGKQYKTVVTCDSTGIKNLHNKVNIESHYIKKGFSAGEGHDMSVIVDGVTINTLECFETLFEANWPGAQLITGSVGFGMFAKTENYNCDYFEQWLTMVKASCLRNTCWALLSCNAQHKDFMTVCVNSCGELVALARVPGFFIVDIDFNDVRRDKQPLLQDSK